MKVFGLSQTSGQERRLFVERGADGIVLIITEHVTNKELTRIKVQPDDVLAVVTDPPTGGATVTGVSPPNGPPMQLHVEVRRNEVLLTASSETGDGADVAIGLDDWQDALESVISEG
jgi:hypothetical protein